MLKWITGIALSVGVVFFVAGCKEDVKPEKPTAPAQSSSPATTAPTENKEEPLNIDSPETPEGVTQRFFKAFFGGNDADAFSLLTNNAQEATKENFSAVASDSIKWKIHKVVKNENQRFVVVRVDDYNEEGAITTEEIVFNLKNVSGKWRVAGFMTNGVAVNYEVNPKVAPQTAAEQIQISSAPQGNSVVR